MLGWNINRDKSILWDVLVYLKLRFWTTEDNLDLSSKLSLCSWANIECSFRKDVDVEASRCQLKWDPRTSYVYLYATASVLNAVSVCSAGNSTQLLCDTSYVFWKVILHKILGCLIDPDKISKEVLYKSLDLTWQTIVLVLVTLRRAMGRTTAYTIGVP